MKIKLLHAMAGPEEAHHAGAVIDVDEKKGKEWIEGKYAIAHRAAPAPARKGAQPAASAQSAQPAAVEAEGAAEAKEDAGRQARKGQR